jgi:hypothetical protein
MIKHETIPDPIASEAVKIFETWVRQIPLLKEMSFPRWIGGQILFLAVFGDASKLGMGVAAYTVCKDEKGRLVSNLAFSKSSLMPKLLRGKALEGDALTIARAELVAFKMALTVGLLCPQGLQFRFVKDGPFYRLIAQSPKSSKRKRTL